MILGIFGLTLFNFGVIFAIFGHSWTESLLLNYFYTLKLLLEPVFFVMESTFSMEKFSRFAVGFRRKVGLEFFPGLD